MYLSWWLLLSHYLLQNLGLVLVLPLSDQVWHLPSVFYLYVYYVYYLQLLLLLLLIEMGGQQCPLYLSIRGSQYK